MTEVLIVNESANEWSCEDCTFINSGEDLTCLMCYRVRVTSKDVKFMWEWQAGDQWIPYDAPTNAQIEKAYQSRDHRVRLSKGHYFSLPQNSAYEIRFFYDHTFTNLVDCYQLNKATGGARRVKRIGDNLFQELDKNMIATEDVCSICQSSLNVDPEANVEPATASIALPKPQTDPIVKLPACSNACQYHRSCISSWIKLKNHCPRCHKNIF